MRLAWAVAVLASYAGLDARAVSSRRAMAGEASLFQIRSQHPAQGRFISRGLVFGKSERERKMVPLRIVKIPGFEQARMRQRPAFESRNAEQKTDPVALAADHAFHGKIESWLSWHLHSILQVPADSL